jgi:hypothetical protein
VSHVSKLFNLLTDIAKAGRFVLFRTSCCSSGGGGSVVVVVFVASAVYLVYLGSENCHYRFIREHSRTYKIHDINSVLFNGRWLFSDTVFEYGKEKSNYILTELTP